MHLRVVSPLAPPAARDRLLRLPKVEEMTGCRKSSIYEWMRLGTFPKSIRLNARTVAWSESDVSKWVQDRIAESRAAQAQGGAQ